MKSYFCNKLVLILESLFFLLLCEEVSDFLIFFKANMIFLPTFSYENVYILYMAPYEKSNFSWKYLPNPNEFEKKPDKLKKHVWWFIFNLVFQQYYTVRLIFVLCCVFPANFSKGSKWKPNYFWCDHFNIKKPPILKFHHQF